MQQLPWGDIIKGGVSLLGAFAGKDAAKSAARAGTPTPYSVQGPAGGFNVDPASKQISLSMAANPFAQMFNALGAGSFANAATAPGSFLYGADPEIANAYKGLFGQGLTGNIQSQLDLLRKAAAPEENRQALALDDNLFARGMLGTTGGAERFRAQQEAFGQNDLQRQLAAIGLGRQEGLDRFTGATGAVSQGMAGQSQNFGIGQGAFGGLQALFQNLINQGQLGVGAAAGVPPQLAAMQAQASQAPWQAGYNFLNQSGAFDKLGSILGGGAGAAPRAPIMQQPGGFDPSIYG